MTLPSSNSVCYDKIPEKVICKQQRCIFYGSGGEVQNPKDRLSFHNGTLSDVLSSQREELVFSQIYRP